MIRLSPHERDAVCRTLHGADPKGRAWLFGSRADESRRGGDIVPERTVDRCIAECIAENKIERRGSKKTGGYWPLA
jgi:hypothetical protein